MLKETVEIKVDYEKAGVSSEGCAPVLDCYYNTLTEEIGRKKHKAIIICPGGGYDWCSEREAEPVAFRFLGAGICAFVLRYSCVKKKFPTDALECAAAVKYVRDNAEKFDIDPDKIVLDNIGMVINRGEKVAFVGKNGEGKSTLAKCILQEIEYSGKLELGYNVKIGYFAQNQPSLLDESLSVFQTVDNVAVGDIRTRLREILGSFMFGGEAIEKKVKVLSGGERSRLAMVRLLLEPANLLILDEPTNHLDIPSKEVLKEAIKAFDGTAIIVSHDREFLDGLVDKVFEFGNKKVREHIGGIYDFLQKKKIENLNELGV
jgi:ATPase subunit of ABC transporter with duplicated ATPase domains